MDVPIVGRYCFCYRYNRCVVSCVQLFLEKSFIIIQAQYPVYFVCVCWFFVCRYAFYRIFYSLLIVFMVSQISQRRNLVSNLYIQTCFQNFRVYFSGREERKGRNCTHFRRNRWGWKEQKKKKRKKKLLSWENEHGVLHILLSNIIYPSLIS